MYFVFENGANMIFTLEIYLACLKDGSWFTFTDHENKVYDNLIILDNSDKPTEQECIDGVKAMQTKYDAQEYARNRGVVYPSIGDQLDALYHAGVFPADMAAKIKKVKDDNPKPE